MELLVELRGQRLETLQYVVEYRRRRAHFDAFHTGEKALEQSFHTAGPRSQISRYAG